MSTICRILYNQAKTRLNSMKFPISRETLQSYTFEKIREQENEEKFQAFLDEKVNDLCKQFQSIFTRNRYPLTDMRSLTNILSQKKFVWYIENNLNVGMLGSTNRSEKEVIHMFIEKLKTFFVDCIITIDPVATYILIDWN